MWFAGGRFGVFVCSSSGLRPWAWYAVHRWIIVVLVPVCQAGPVAGNVCIPYFTDPLFGLTNRTGRTKASDASPDKGFVSVTIDRDMHIDRRRNR